MRILFFLIVLTVLFSACDHSSDAKSKRDYVDYFYPTDSLIPFIYVFQDEKNPLNEKMHRIYRLETPSDTSLVVEYFNADFRITEGYSFDIHDFLVIDHMIVDGDGLKRKAKITSNSFFPLSKDELTCFISDFPSHLDSVTMVYQSNKSIVNTEYKIDVLGENVTALLIKDSITVTFANVFTQKASTQKVVIDRFFAKGFGLVRWSSSDGSIVYDLKKVLSNRWWEEVVQSPQVK